MSIDPESAQEPSKAFFSGETKNLAIKLTPLMSVWGSFFVALLVMIVASYYILNVWTKPLGLTVDPKDYKLTEEQLKLLEKQGPGIGDVAGDISVLFKYKSIFLDEVTFEKEITASNIIYNIQAGQGISISGDPQQPVISVTNLPEIQQNQSNVNSLQDLTGDVSLEAGDNVTISKDGNKIKIASKTFTSGTTLSESEVEAMLFDADNTGTLSSGTLDLANLSYSGILPSSVLSGTYSGITGVGTLTGLSVSGTSTFSGGIQLGGVYINDFVGDGLTISSNTLQVSLAAGSGLDFSNGSLSIRHDCSGGEVLSWSGSSWDCAVVSGVGGTINKTGSPLAGYMTYWSGSSAITGQSALFTDGTNVGLGTTAPNYRLDVNGAVRIGTTAIISGGITLGGDYVTDITGSGLVNNAGAVSLDTSGVVAGTYGSSALIPVINVDQYGRITSVSNIAVPSGFQDWYINAGGNVAQVISGQTVTFNAGTGIGITHSSRNITINNNGVTSLNGTTNQISASSNTGAITLSLPQNIHTGATVQFAGLNVGGDIITEFMGNGLTVSSNTLSLRLASGSGLEFNSGSVSMLRSCNPNEVLAWVGGAWTCSSVSGIGGITKTDSPNTGYLTFWSSSSSITGVNSLYTDGTNLGIGTTAPGYKLDVSGTLGVSNTATFSGGFRVNNQTFTNLVGSGLSNSSGTLGLSTSGVTAGTYGSTTLIPVITVDQYGRITSVTNSTFSSGYQDWELNVGGVVKTVTNGSTVIFVPGTGIGITNNDGTITFNNNGVTSILGTSNQVSANTSTGTVTLSLPQNIHTGATVQFTGLTLGGDTITEFMGNGLTVSSNTLSLRLASGSGLEFSSGSVSLLRSCNSSEILSWNGSAWVCNTVSGLAGISGSGTQNYLNKWTSATTQSISQLYDDGTNIGLGMTNPSYKFDINGSLRVGSTAIVSGGISLNGDYISDFTGGGLAVSGGALTNTGVTFITGTSNQISVSTNTGAVTLSLPQNIHTGATVQFTGLTLGGDTITEFMGNGLTVGSNTLSLRLATGSGLEFSSGSISMLRSCGTNEVLAWNGSSWGCSSVSGVGGLTGTGIANYAARWISGGGLGTGALYDDGTNIGIGTTNPGQKLSVAGSFGIQEGGVSPQYYSIFQGGDQSANITYTLPTSNGSSGYVLMNDGSGQLSWQSVTGGAVGAGDISAVGNITSGDAFTSGTPGSQLYFNNGGFLGLNSNAGRIRFADNTTDVISFMDANVGIGTSSPSTKFEINTGLGHTAPQNAIAITSNVSILSIGESADINSYIGTGPGKNDGVQQKLIPAYSLVIRAYIYRVLG